MPIGLSMVNQNLSGRLAVILQADVVNSTAIDMQTLLNTRFALFRGFGLVTIVIIAVLRILLFFCCDKGAFCFVTFFLEQAGTVSKVKNCYAKERQK